MSTWANFGRVHQDYDRYRRTVGSDIIARMSEFHSRKSLKVRISFMFSYEMTNEELKCISTVLLVLEHVELTHKQKPKAKNTLVSGRQP